MLEPPVRAPNANAHAERFIRTLREECLDWLLILSRRTRVLREYVEHYNRERPHRALELRAPQLSPQVIALRSRSQTAVSRRDRLGGRDGLQWPRRPHPRIHMGGMSQTPNM